MTVGARQCESHDNSQVERLRAQAEDEIADLRGGRRLLSYIEAQRVDMTIVGLINDHPVGFVTVVFEPPIATVHELFVEPSAREVGVAHAMIETVGEIALQQGCTELDAVVLPGSRESKNFFESHAMVSRLLTVSRRLDG